MFINDIALYLNGFILRVRVEPWERVGLGCKDQHVHCINIFNKIKLLSYPIVILIPPIFVSLSMIRVSVQLHKFPPSLGSEKVIMRKMLGATLGNHRQLISSAGFWEVSWSLIRASKNKSKLAR